MFIAFRKHVHLQLVIILALLTTLVAQHYGTPSKAIANPNPQAPLTQFIQSSDGRLSLRLPDGWSYTDVVASENMLAYGDSQAAADARLNDVRGQSASIVGNGGTIILLNVADYGYTAASIDALTAVLNAGLDGVKNIGGSIIETSQPIEINPGQTIALAVIAAGGEQGYAATLGFGDMMVLMTATGTLTTWEANRDLLYSIIQTVRVPADVSTTPPDTTSTRESTLVRAIDGSLSVEIPTGWSFRDELVENQIFVFGETEAEMENRSIFWISNENVVVSGRGGFISSRLLTDLSLDPANVDILAATNTFVANLGVSVIEPALSFVTTNNAPGAYAVVDWGQQRGLLGFVVFGDTLAIVYISDNPTNFQSSRNSLLPILESVRMPAEIAAPPTAGTGNTGTTVPAGDGGTGLGGVITTGGTQGQSSVPLPQALRNETGTLEVFLPETWQTYIAPAEEATVQGADTIYFASSQNEINVLRSSGLPSEPGGLIIFFDRALLDPTLTATPEQLLALLDSPIVSGRSDTKTDTINGNTAIWYEFNQETPTQTRGYWIVFVFEDKLALMALRTPPSDWENSGPTLDAIFRSVRYNPEGLSGLGSTGGLGSLGGSATPAPLRPSGATPTPTRPPASATPTFTPTTDSGQLQNTPGGPTPTPTLSSVG